MSEVDIPFELVGEVASAGAVAEAGHVKGSSSARHGEDAKKVVAMVRHKRADGAARKKRGEEI